MLEIPGQARSKYKDKPDGRLISAALKGSKKRLVK
jgi:hypothetical protein